MPRGRRRSAAYVQLEKPAADYLGGRSIDGACSVEERRARTRIALTWWEKTTWTVCTSVAEVRAATLKGRWGVAVAPLGPGLVVAVDVAVAASTTRISRGSETRTIGETERSKAKEAKQPADLSAV